MENEKWIKVLKALRNEISGEEHEMYLKPIKVISFTESELILSVENTFLRDVIIERYKKKIEKTINKIFNINIYINFKIKKSEEVDNNLTEEKPVKNKSSKKKSSIDFLNEKFTFTKFVPGPSNELAYAAAKRISVAPGKQYNPFFYYGHTGLGKTHLLQAIGHEVIAQNPKLNVLYVTSEKFLDEYVHSLTENKVRDFRNKYRNTDVLLIDDVHFYEGKVGVQDELFNTFNLLFQENKQMVFTSDRPTKELKGLQDRLISRFSQGLVADIRPPGYEERKAILNQKVRDLKLDILPDVLNFLAEKITSNVRNLEGAINKIMAIQDLKNKKLDIEDIKYHLEDVLDIVKKVVTPHEILKSVSEYYDLSVSDLRSKSRKKEIVKPRQMAMYIMRKLTNLSLMQIGYEFGGRDHSTVSYACDSIENEIKENISTRNDYEQLFNRLIK